MDWQAYSRHQRKPEPLTAQARPAPRYLSELKAYRQKAMGMRHFNLGVKTKILVRKKLSLVIRARSNAKVMAIVLHLSGPDHQPSLTEQSMERSCRHKKLELEFTEQKKWKK